MKSFVCTSILALSAISLHAQTNQTQGNTTSGAQGSQSDSSASGNTNNGTGATLQTTVGVGVGNGPQTTSTSVGPTTSGASATAAPSTSGATATGKQTQQTTASGGQSSSVSAGGAGGSSIAHGGAGGSAQGGTATGGVASTGASSSATTVDTSNHSINSQTYEGSKALFLPPVTPPLPPQVVPSANTVTTTTACGPRMTVVREPVMGHSFGLFGKHKEFVTGFTYTLLPEMVDGKRVRYNTEPWTDGVHTGRRRFGTQAIIFASVVSSSAGRQIGAAGNGGGSFSGGQIAMGATSSIQEQGEHIQILDCALPIEVDAPPPAPAPEPVVEKVYIHDAAPAITLPPTVVLHHHKQATSGCKK